jgi:mRNA interferase MazF
MPNYLKNEVILIRYPFSDLTNFKVRPAVVVNAPHSSQDVFIVPLTSKTKNLLSGEFVLTDWQSAGLNIKTAAKHGVYTIKESLIRKKIGLLSIEDSKELENSIRPWFGL